ncbi:LysR family transcriptional regulator [Pseudomonas sp. Pse1]|uniref:LysR family transcriptional regulator n=1 Tax=Pseudomonas sp. Pse1 TaxID=2926020 RepID=UPI00211884CD|nr:LysR family transcriptional regulator [Pseudomonas sp. Pse1]
MNWEDLRYFVAIASAGTLSGASRQLGVDQATVSRRLAALETDLGARLVDRQPRKAFLTPLGQEVLTHALKIEDSVFAVKRLSLSASSQSRAKITISAPPILARHFFAPQLLVLSQRLPQVQVSVLSESHVASLSKLEADLAIRLTPGTADSDIVKRIGEMQFGLYSTPSYANVANPQQWEFIGYTEYPVAFDHKNWLYQTIGNRRVVCEVADLSNQYEAACTGIGVAGLPCFLADQDERLLRLSSSQKMLSLGIFLALHPDRRNDQLVRDTSAVIMELITDLGLT